MWVFTNHGFLSIVEHSKRKDTLVVRARRKEHLETYFNEFKINYTPNRDYQYRIFITKKYFADHMHSIVQDIDYPNFKSSIKDKKLGAVASMVWHNVFVGLDEGNRTMVSTSSKDTGPYGKDRKPRN
mgnify:CR=1 FL=1|tara:strand:+ start:163 stop:543 length:381 start_codon:yes stop_codon:yes gene_type:complete